MGLAAEFFGLAALLALVVAVAVVWLSARMWPGAAQVAQPIAVAAGFIAGYLLLPRSWTAMLPTSTQAWTWLPWLGLLAAGLSAIGSVPALSRWRVLPVFAMALAGCLCLAPSWPVYGATGVALRALLMLYFACTGLALVNLHERVGNRWFAFSLAVAAAVVAISTGVMVSVRFGQLGGIGAGAFLGCWASSRLFDRQPTSSRSSNLVPIYIVLVAGLAWIGAAEPDPPQLGLMAIPQLPAALWLAWLANRYLRRSAVVLS
jgi:hypothetical protein